MNKLIVAIGAIACAVSLQAAQISWGGDICLPDAATPVGAGSVAYLIRSSTATAISTIYCDGADWSAWTTDVDGAVIVGAHTVNALEAESNFAFADSYTIKGAEDAGYYSVVVVDGSAGADGLKGSYNLAGQNTLTSPTDPTIVNLKVSDGWGSEWLGNGGFEAVTFTTEAVPEPTSGLLLLLGMAGLALKRKQA